MNELQRQSYLSALGLDNYAPRWLLPGAPVSVPCARPEPPRAPVDVPVQAEAERAAVESAPAATPLAEVMREMAGPAASAPAPVQAPARDTKSPRVAPFTLSIWRSSAPLLVLDARQPRSALPTERLLRNLLAALGLLDSASVTEEVLPWPLVAPASAEPGADDARAELHTWLEAELTRRPVRGLLLMGDNAARHLLPTEADLEALRWHKADLPAFDCPALVLPSLVELLQAPLQKRALWRALSVFRGL